ncbi:MULTISPECIES: recombinase family protein [Pirellulaceae]|uniref:recombinase family protein n=1 Tax=Pirellulaceae TaxID=2691357 RepID=UPI001304FD13|nr:MULTISPECIES: recombinase family protein [Pirellulaceae]
MTVAIGRVSKPKESEAKTQLDLQSSFAAVRNVLSGIYDGPLDLTELGEQSSGLIADRATALEAMDLISTGNVDLVIAEDLSKIFRNPRLQWIFVQDAVDVGTRVILFGDNLDTADPDWEIQMGMATLRHGLYIPDARRRVRRTATFSFHKGGHVQKIKYGFRKLSLDEAQSGEYGPVGLEMPQKPGPPL